MSQFSRPPLPGGNDWKTWARQLYDYLNAQSPIKGSVEPQAPLLPHQVNGQMARAATDGILMFHPTDGVVVAKAGAWVPLQDLLVSGVTIKTINGVTLLGSGNLVVGGGSLQTGSASLNFGTSGTDAFVDVTGQAAILGTSEVLVSIRMVDTAENTIEDILLDPPLVMAGNIIPGTGFTIYGKAISGSLHGNIEVNWVWS